jgi:hypothetical protein
MSAAGGRRKKQKRASNGRDAEPVSPVEPTEQALEQGGNAQPAADDPAAALAEGSVPSDEADAQADAAGDEASTTEESGIVEAESAGAEAAGEGEAPAVGPAQPLAELDRARQKAAIESLIFVSDRPVTAVQLGRALKLKSAFVRELIAELTADYGGHGIELIEVASGYQSRARSSRRSR